MAKMYELYYLESKSLSDRVWSWIFRLD